MKEKIFYCDTNILRYLVDHREKWAAFYRYLSEHNALLVISLIQIIEIKKLPRYQQGISELLLGTQSAVFRWWRDILIEESKTYPNTGVVCPYLRPILTDLLYGSFGQINLETVLDGYEIDLMWQSLDDSKEKYMKVLAWLHSTAPNFPASKDNDFLMHNYGFVMSEVGDVNPDFIVYFKSRANEFQPELFQGSYLRAAYTYYRYILKGIAPQPSDVGDIHQVFYMPYCDKVVVEKSMESILYQLRKDKGLISETEIRSIRFIRNLPKS